MPAREMSTVLSGPALHSGKRNPKRDPAAGGDAHFCTDRTSVEFAASPGEAETHGAAMVFVLFFLGWDRELTGLVCAVVHHLKRVPHFPTTVVLFLPSCSR